MGLQRIEHFELADGTQFYHDPKTTAYNLLMSRPTQFRMRLLRKDCTDTLRIVFVLRPNNKLGDSTCVPLSTRLTGWR